MQLIKGDLLITRAETMRQLFFDREKVVASFVTKTVTALSMIVCVYGGPWKHDSREKRGGGRGKAQNPPLYPPSISPVPSVLQRCAAGAEIVDLSGENPELSKDLPFKPGVGQIVQFCVLQSRNSSFPVHYSVRFLPKRTVKSQALLLSMTFEKLCLALIWPSQLTERSYQVTHPFLLETRLGLSLIHI